MEINADFSQRSLLHTPQLDWQDSPMKGVRRRVLDRVGNEVARATTIVSYAPESHFSSHVHTGGEEFIVLEGVFQDEHGDFPAGHYVRNPPQSSHTPRSDKGCTIFVKLWQFDLQDRQSVAIDMNTAPLEPDNSRQGVQFNTLFQDDRETVRLEQWQAGAMVSLDTSGGAELLVLDGHFSDGDDKVETLSWLRLPVGSDIQAIAGPTGARVWVKTGHLRFTEQEKARLP
ncbi:cupin domain-containing protein [Granulosicoccus sp. 3-233]|uniref:cupin domain-containing protein n=1 Tax=Granulosicoccus sp. 3-233 TaxID=3417969 RepID=UPI003D33275D